MATPNVAVIVGSSKGLGLHLARSYLARTDLHVVSLSRSPSQARKAILDTSEASPLSTGVNGGDKKGREHDAASLSGFDGGRLTSLEVDAKQEDSIAQAASEVEKKFGQGSLKLLFNVAGVLTPEKNLAQVDYQKMLEQFQLNTFFPLLSYKHFAPLIPKPGPVPDDAPCLSHGLLPRGLSVCASLSARVGSIADNERGGWYSYRASKAAQNQITKSVSREMYNKNLNAIALALHPGTVRSDLSKEFTGGPNSSKQKDHGEFEAHEAAANLVNVLSKTSKEHNGKFLDWAGKEVPW
ncbi:unnamed protein product [Sympodiomycopsis kandeliae]